MSILETIFAYKRAEVAAARERIPFAALEAALKDAPPPRDFAAALRDDRRPAPRLIAELKRQSPSKGVLCTDFRPLELAQAYRQGGAAALSVLTDARYFGGSLDVLRTVWPVGLPCLRKDFLFDRYQVLEARAAGADAVLLILAMLPPETFRDLLDFTRQLGMTALVETHTTDEVRRALDAGARVIGINNRDLHTFTVRLETCLELRPLIPPAVMVVAESGIHTPKDVRRLAAAGVDAMLVGEALVTAPDPAAATRQLAGARPA